jgi:hypothetical protein
MTFVGMTAGGMLSYLNSFSAALLEYRILRGSPPRKLRWVNQLPNARKVMIIVLGDKE